MNGSSLIRFYVIQHKGFLIHYALSLAIALSLVCVSFRMGWRTQLVDSPVATSTSQPGVAPNDQYAKDQQQAQKIRDDDLFWRFHNDPANLSPSQWKELQNVLLTLPEFRREFSKLTLRAGQRRDELLKYSSFVFSHSKELPDQVIADWSEFSSTEVEYISDFGVSVPQYDDWQRSFLSKTLSVEEVCTMASEFERFERVRSEVMKSTTLIDRITPVLSQNGVDFAELYGRPGIDSGIPEPKRSFPNFPDDAKYPPSELPTLSFNRTLILQQMQKPPMSNGATSAKRAG